MNTGNATTAEKLLANLAAMVRKSRKLALPSQLKSPEEATDLNHWPDRRPVNPPDPNTQAGV